MGKEKKKGSAAVFKAGAVSLAFLVIGYEAALFVHRAAVLRIEAAQQKPDTVYVMDEALARKVLGAPAPDSVAAAAATVPAATASAASLPKSFGPSADGRLTVRKQAPQPPQVEKVLSARTQVESFAFNPNTVSVEELQRLGFSPAQARSIDNYRSKGGRFRRKSDFAKSFVVSDSVYARLEPYIDIPLVDINKADSAAFDALPGIGGWFAARMVSYRAELGGYSYPEQLMDIYHFDRQKYDALSDLVCCSPPSEPFALWTLDAEGLRAHPYLKSWQTARSIVLFRENTPRGQWSVDALETAGILDSLTASRLRRCVIAQP